MPGFSGSSHPAIRALVAVSRARLTCVAVLGDTGSLLPDDPPVAELHAAEAVLDTLDRARGYRRTSTAGYRHVFSCLLGVG